MNSVGLPQIAQVYFSLLKNVWNSWLEIIMELVPFLFYLSNFREYIIEQRVAH
jgi:hypothetical protein